MGIQVNFILVADGRIGLPSINSVIWGESNAKAVSEAIDAAEKQAVALSKAGYSRFTLFDMSLPDHHKPIASFTVEQAEPVVNKRVVGE